MPIYEYECTKCGHHCEKLQKFSDDPLKDCPECKQPALEKQISLSGFHLKGTGWYVTDYTNNKKPAKSEAKSEDAKGGSDTGSTGDASSGSGGSSSSGSGSSTTTNSSASSSVSSAATTA